MYLMHGLKSFFGVKKRDVLLTPGPVNVHEKVLQANSNQPVMHHRMHSFERYHKIAEALLAEIFGFKKRYGIGFLTASGTGMTEAMIRHLGHLSPTGVVILSNGHFGDRLSIIAKNLGYSVKVISYLPTEDLPLGLVEKAFAEGYRAVAAVYHETSVGQVNCDLDKVVEIAEVFNAYVGVDLVSALGGERIDFKKFTPHFMVSVSGKALGALSGIGVAIVRKDVLQILKAMPIKEHYFSFVNYIDCDSLSAKVPFTPSINVFPAFVAALEMIQFEGLEQKFKRHETGILMLEVLASRFGFSCVKVKNPSLTTRCFRYAESQENLYDEFSNSLQSQGFMPLQNLVTQREKCCFQFSTMGYVDLDGIRTLCLKMRNHASGFQADTEKLPITGKVFFDFDGTLVKSDTVILFLKKLLVRHGWRLVFSWPFLVVGIFFQRFRGLEDLGFSLILWSLTVFLPARKFLKTAKDFALHYSKHRLRKETVQAAVNALEFHLSSSDEVFIISGSAGYWAKPILRALTNKDVKFVGTSFRRSFGGLVARERCYRSNKLDCFVAKTGLAPTFCKGYSDSINDMPLAQRSREFYLVNPKANEMRAMEVSAW